MEYARVTTGTQDYITDASARVHTWHADAGEGAGGQDTAPNPEEMLLGALGSCITQTLHMYANRKGWPLERVEVDLAFEKLKAADVPEYTGDAKFVHYIRHRIRIYGDLDEKQRERLMEISERCPVRRILNGPTSVVNDETIDYPEAE